MDFKIEEIDWNEEWKKADPKRRTSKMKKEFWNACAPSFASDPKHKSDYPEQFIKILSPEKNDSLLDVGCGTGLISIPVSSMVKKVTAIDFSEKMLEILEHDAAAKDIKNIKTGLVSIEDDWDLKGVEVHDVVIASRSLITGNLKEAMEKLNRYARKKVCISTIAGEGPFDKRIFESVGRKVTPARDYIYNLNILHQMGIYANLLFTYHPVSRTYETRQSAFDSCCELISEITDKERKKLKSWLDNVLVFEQDAWVISGSPAVRWAVIWWEK